MSSRRKISGCEYSEWTISRGFYFDQRRLRRITTSLAAHRDEMTVTTAQSNGPQVKASILPATPLWNHGKDRALFRASRFRSGNGISSSRAF